MSKSMKRERTRGFLPKLAKTRKTRKQIRDMKADSLFHDWDIKPQNRLVQAQHAT